jgi:hypothetical protein
MDVSVPFRPHLRAPSTEGAAGASVQGVTLRLAIGRQGIGLELAAPVRLECLRVTEMVVGLPGMRFPVDVSGGVARFRHRRGCLELAQLELHARELESWLAVRLHGLVGSGPPEVWLGMRPEGVTVCLRAAKRSSGADDEQGVLVFDLAVLPEDDELRLVIDRPRGSGLPASPAALAIACLSEALRPLGRGVERRGCVFVVHLAARSLSAALWPEAGARAPSAADVRWASFRSGGDAWVLRAVRESVPAPPGEGVVRAMEVGTLLRAGDDALVGGDRDGARVRYLEALERAPRHREIVARVAALDAMLPGRAEAALTLLADLRGDDRVRLGTLPGELLGTAGDRDAAVASLERSAQLEDAPPLAARALELAARWSADAVEAARLLDEALARSPRSTSARWARLRRRLELGRPEDALADAEHLEASANGPRAKHEVWVEAGSEWQSAGFVERAAAVFERALVYAPDEPRSLAGLGSALLASGQAARGATLLRRALDLAEHDGAPHAGIRLALARALAERLDDLPAAIAHVALVPAGAMEAPMARGLEGRWRARLGDLAGASLAFARLRELSEAIVSHEDPRAEAVAALLREAAQTQRERAGDVASAKRHLGAALRLRPADADLRREYRELGAPAARGRAPTSFPATEASSDTHRTVLAHRSQPLDLALAADPEEDALEAQRVLELTRQLQSDATNEAAAEELAGLLEHLGRGHELVALLFARLEDAQGETRAALEEQARARLERAALAAEERGRAEDAALLRGALAALPC